MAMCRNTHVRAHMHTYVHARAACPLNDMVCTVRGTGVQRQSEKTSWRQWLLKGCRIQTGRELDSQEVGMCPCIWGCGPFVHGRRTRVENSDCKIEMTYEWGRRRGPRGLTEHFCTVPSTQGRPLSYHLRGEVWGQRAAVGF